jgi:DNA-binding NarL/FixJ family response regulator
MNNKRCRILICDDRPEYRELVKLVLGREPDIEIVGEAGNGREGVDEALRLRPHVVLMDLNMPELTGLEATRRIGKASKRIKVLIVSAFGSEAVLMSCLQAGASGFVQKHRLSELAPAIYALKKGETYAEGTGADGG